MSNPSTPRGLHGLAVLDDEAVEWLLNTCPEIKCGLAVDSNNSLKRSEKTHLSMVIPKSH